MSPGNRTGSFPADSAADPFGWRLANALAIVAPYLLAAALFIVLYLQPASPPAADAALATAPAPAGDLAAPPVAAPPVAANVPTPVTPTPSHAAAPAPPKSAAPPVSRAGSPAGSPHAAPAPAKAPPLPTQPVPVDPVIAGTMKISGDPPPDNARIQGVVVVALTVGADGAVQSVQAVSGPGLLELAALNTVRSWRYRPWLVEGHPVPFTTQVVFNYTFGSPSQ